MRSAYCLAIATIAVTLPMVANGQTDHRKYAAGIGIGTYLPSGSEIQSIFGHSIGKIGLDFGAVPHLRTGKLGFAAGYVSASSGNNKFALLQGMVDYTIGLGKPNSDFIPYLRIGAGVAYADYAIDRIAGHFSNKTFTPTGQVELGAYVGRSLHLTATYDFFGALEGLNFNGLELKATFIVYRF